MIQPNPNAAGPNESEIHLRDYWGVVWKGRWTFLAVFVGLLGIVAAWTFLQTPIFRAVATVEIQPQARRLGPGQDVSGLGVSSYGWFAEERYQNTQIEIVKSRDVAGYAFESLGLADDPRFRGQADPVAAFIGGIKVEPRRETGLIEISTQGPDSEEAARWANAVADAYVRRNLDRARGNIDAAIKQIEGLLEPMRDKLSAAETEKFQVLRDKEIYSPQNQQEVVKQRLTKLSAEATEMQTRLLTLRSTLEKASEIRRGGGDASSLPEIAEDPQIGELRRQRNQAERELEAARVTLRPGHTEFQAKQSNLQKIDQRLREQVSLVLGKLQNEYELAERNERELQRKIREAGDFAFRVDVAMSEFDVAKSDAQSKKQIYDAITKTMNEVSLGLQLLANNVSVLDYAIPPVVPVKPSKRLNLFLGAMMGLFLGLGAVFFLDYLDNTLHSPEDVERFAQVNTLAVVPKYTDGEAIPRAVREAYQTLRTSLIFSSRNRDRKVVLVTSSAPQEGKSSTVAQLAKTLAGAGDRVLVLDCDLRRPTQHIHLGVDREPGLTNFLASGREGPGWPAFVKTVGPENLHTLTCGPIPPNPPELLGSDRFGSLVGEARQRYDWVLIDSPPTMTLSDSAVLGRIAEMTVVVVRHNKTDRALVARSVQQLRAVGVEVTGAVLNSVDLGKGGRSDYYYAGYYYYADDDGERKSRKKSVAAAAERSG